MIIGDLRVVGRGIAVTRVDARVQGNLRGLSFFSVAVSLQFCGGWAGSAATLPGRFVRSGHGSARPVCRELVPDGRSTDSDCAR